MERQYLKLMDMIAAIVGTLDKREMFQSIISHSGRQHAQFGAKPLHFAAFRHGLGEGGFVEGQNVAIEFRWARGQYERLRALAAELVSRRVAVLVAVGGDPSALAAKAATSTIPIVFNSTDPIKSGL